MPWLLINLINRRIHKSRHKAISIIACTKFARQPSGPHLLFQMDKVKKIPPPPQSLPYPFKSTPDVFDTCLPMAGSDRGSVTSHVPTHHFFSHSLPSFQVHLQQQHESHSVIASLLLHLTVSGYGYFLSIFFSVLFFSLQTLALLFRFTIPAIVFRSVFFFPFWKPSLMKIRGFWCSLQFDHRLELVTMHRLCSLQFDHRS